MELHQAYLNLIPLKIYLESLDLDQLDVQVTTKDEIFLKDGITGSLWQMLKMPLDESFALGWLPALGHDRVSLSFKYALLHGTAFYVITASDLQILEQILRPPEPDPGECPYCTGSGGGPDPETACPVCGGNGGVS